MGKRLNRAERERVALKHADKVLAYLLDYCGRHYTMRCDGFTRGLISRISNARKKIKAASSTDLAPRR